MKERALFWGIGNVLPGSRVPMVAGEVRYETHVPSVFPNPSRCRVLAAIAFQ